MLDASLSQLHGCCRVEQSSINVCTTYALCVLVSYVYLKRLTAVNFKNERKKKKKNALNIRGTVWSWKKKLNRVC